MVVVYLLLFFVFLFMGVPIAISLGAAGSLWLISQPGIPNMLLATKIFAGTDSFAMMAIPFFMLAGQFMEHTGITQKIVDFAKSLVGHIPGGLAHTACVSGMIMAGISGSGNADTAAIGNIMLPALTADGYDEGFAVSVMASSGALGPIIPPSVFMIIFANCANYSVGKMFMGGMIPGVIMGLGFMVICYVYAKRHHIGGGKFLGLKNVWKQTLSAIGALIMPVIIVGGITTGVFTATEAGVIASVYGFFYGLFTRSIDFKLLKESLLNAVLASVGPMMIITYSSIYAYMLARMNVSALLGEYCLAHIHSEAAFLIFIVIIATIAGCFIDAIATLYILLPVFTPVVKALGVDFQHFAVVFSMGLLTCQITPPVGSLLYVAAGIRNTPIKKIIKHIWPFIIIMIIVIMLSIFIPEIVCWLPALIYG
ncbi:MAG: TRAP transporter large permease subunit [Pyramidobacter sp.]|nr:TRAP transporter large permease subunit [Pyramidobacter sp.]